MIPKKADAVIIGGGAMGLSIAYHLSRRGFSDVVVLEKEEYLGGHTTSRCAGGVRHQFSTGINVRLSLLSTKILKDNFEEFNYNAEMNCCGYMFLLTEEEDLASFQTAADIQRSLGVDTKWIAGDEIRKEYPMMNIPDVLAATYYKYDGLIEPDSVLKIYTNSARRRGVKFFTDTPIINIGIKNSRIESVDTPNGTISTPVVVNAAGPWAYQIGQMAGVNIPVKPVLQQVFLTTRIPWVSKNFPVMIFPREGLGFHSEDHGLLTGMTKPETDCSKYELEIDNEWELLHCQKAAERVFDIANAGIKTRWAGFYEMTSDDHPILGSIPQVEGFYCAAGFSGHGFMHSPVTGLLMSEEILDGKAHSLDISELRIQRFNSASQGLHEIYKL